MFNLVFALGKCDKDEIDMFYLILKNISVAFKYEQLRRGFIRLETEIILDVKDKHQKLDKCKLLI